MIALYLRLSASDGDLGSDGKEESNSIENQRALLYDFVEQRDDVSGEVREYIDDGYSGTNFDRPGFQEMLEDMKKGRISVLLTKDLSRLGRNYIEVGDYMEQIFPMLGVRYIAINSNYDSNDHPGNTMGIEMSMMNLLNTMYSKDLSKKVKSGLKTRWKNGKSTYAIAPFGYVKDPKQTDQWLIEPIAAKIVRRIFDLALKGETVIGIVNALNQDQVLTPGQYREKYGYFRRVDRKVSDSEWLWNGNTVRNILKDYSYTGALVAGKATAIIVGNTARRKVSDADRVVFEGHHEAIVSKEEFKVARSIIRSNQQNGVINHDDYALGKVVHCGNCGLKMAVSTGLDRYFQCSHKKNTGRFSKCDGARYPAEKVEFVVRRALRRQLLFLERLDKDMESAIRDLPDRTDDIHKMRQQLQTLRAAKTQDYESYAERLLDKNTYLQRREELTQRIAKIENDLCMLLDPEEKLDALKKEADHYMMLANQLESLSELTPEMVDAFIERINIYDEDHIEIIFQFTDLLRDITSCLDSEQAAAGKTTDLEDGMTHGQKAVETNSVKNNPIESETTRKGEMSA